MPTEFISNFPAHNPPHPALSRILTGHYHTERGYRTVRDNGTHDWLIIHTVSGSGRFINDHGKVTVRSGDVALLAPGVYHDYGIAEGSDGWEILWAHFIPWQHWNSLLNWPLVCKEIRFLRLGKREVRREVETSLGTMNRFGSQRNKHADLLAMNALETALLWCGSANPRSGDAVYDGRIFAATAYLARNFAEEVKLPALANECGLSVSRLSYLFAKQVGMTPMRYLEQQRMVRAMELLRETSLNVTEIAYKVGFNSQSYFSIAFGKCAGKSPREYRRQSRKRQ